MLDGASLSGGSNAGAAGAEASRLELKQKELDASAFRLMMDEMQYDIESFRVFVRNKAQHETQLARQQVAWDKKLADEASSAGEAYLSAHATWFVKQWHVSIRRSWNSPGSC